MVALFFPGGYFGSVRTLGQAPFSCDLDLDSIYAAFSGN